MRERSTALVFRMTRQAGTLLLNRRDMTSSYLRLRLPTEPLFRMTSDALHPTGTVKRNMALRARRDCRMRSAEIAWRPHGLRIVEGFPDDPGNKYDRGAYDDLDDCFVTRKWPHRLQPAEVQCPEDMQCDQDDEGDRNRSMDGTPPSE